MQALKKEGIIVSSYMLLCVLARINIPFIGIASIFAYPVVIGLLIYISIASTNFKTGKLLVIQIIEIIFSIYYKMFFLTALLFALKDYPGKDIISIVALSSALLYILFVALSKVKKELIFVAILYINLFSGFILLTYY
ncbi:MAG: hypothetical protein GX879_04225 [Bacteroidales bacterium]|nr:hypothetical protein [Bacteroidales bacterium]